MIVVVDFDGPIVDVREKYTWVYQEVLGRAGFTPLGPAEYWGRVRTGTSTPDLLEASGAQRLSADTYRDSFRGLVETDAALDRDGLQQDVVGALRRLRTYGYKVALATLRRRPAGVLQQLARLGIAEHFDAVLTIADNRGRATDKRDMVRRHAPKGARIVALVGDTELDIDAASLLETPGIGVTNGLRDAAVLTRCGAAAIAPNLAGAVDWVLERA